MKNPELSKIYEDISKELGVPIEVVEVVHKSIFGLMQENFNSIPYKDIHTQEDFDKYNTVMNIVGFGKFYTTLEKIKRAQKADEYKFKPYEKDKNNS